MATLPDHITPDAAKVEYENYLAQFYGDALRAEFETKKEDPALKRQFDPREIAPLVERRDAAARQRASEGISEKAEDLPPGPLPPPDPIEGDSSDAKREHPRAPVFVWEQEIMASDLTLARRLTRKLDEERGIKENPIAPPIAAAQTDDGTKQADKKSDNSEILEKEPGAEADEQMEDKGQMDQASIDVEEDAKEDASLQALERKEAEIDAARPHQETQEMLDSLIKYLWAVHGIDYYGGRDYADPNDPARRTVRMTLRPEKVSVCTEDSAAAQEGQSDEASHPTKEDDNKNDENEPNENDNEQDEQMEGVVEVENDQASIEGNDGEATVDASKLDQSEQKDIENNTGSELISEEQIKGRVRPSNNLEKGRKAYQARIQTGWKRRIEKGDPLTCRLRKEKADQMFQAWLDDQIIKLDEDKWANKLSEKKFKAKEFVIKHIYNKHQHVVSARKDKIFDEIYYENFKSFREDRSQRNWSGPGRGRHGMRGRGRGRQVPMAPMMMMNVGAPMFIPPGSGIAGMPPVIMAPMMMPMGRGGRSRGRGRGRFSGHRDQYKDLDNPKNNRAVLDYGDL